MTEEDLGVIVPLFTEPQYSDWYQVASVASRYPRVRVMAMVKPPHGAPNPQYQAQIGMLVNSGVRVFGLVRPGLDASDNERMVREYKTFYPKMSGIVIEESPVMDVDIQKDSLVKFANTGFETVLVYSYSSKIDSMYEIGAASRLLLYDGSNYIGNNIGMFIRLDNQGQEREWRKMLHTFYTFKDARWFYFETASDVGRGLSWLFEPTVRELDKIAEQVEGKQLPYEFTQKGGYELTPNTVGLPGGGKEHPGGATGSAKPDVAPNSRVDYDDFGIKKIYPDTQEKKKQLFWANIDTLGGDRGFVIPSSKKYGGAISYEYNKGLENIEFTVYAKLVKNSKNKKLLDQQTPLYTLTVYKKEPKTGYQTILTYGGFARINKIVDGVAGVNRAASGTNHPVTSWLGLKTVYYQHYPESYENTRLAAHIELWMDENCTDSKGNLVVANNNWRLIQNTDDMGNWTFPKPKGKAKLPPKDHSKVLKDKMQGCTFRTAKDIQVEVKYMSIREIQPVNAD